MDNYVSTELRPQAQWLIKKFPQATQAMRPDQVMALIHNRGLPGAVDILSGKADKATTTAAMRYVHTYDRS